MPSVSDKQKKAMQAAAHGKSTLGIPAKIGKEFAAADKKRGKSPFKLGKSQKGKSKT
jgi:hypothetical protein